MLKYPARFEPAEAIEGGYVITFRDIPEAITQGDDEAEAREMAADALLTSMDFYFEGNRPVAMPSEPLDGEVMIELPVSVSVKVLLLNEMLAQHVTPSELARRMNTSPQTVNRIMTLKHSTKIDTLADAFKVLGKRLDISVRLR
ncbi:type II toxin-antitoxin system HicB family antitoxin [Burkholderia plantarii]|uniref:type II toxin-antitoxin system HicB family antitoxin n=1 Tax=Burkholderia plantarii TaxID=41899 RepID=UPI0006D8CD21|nr:type II toxin-antitoxin system HicB family antitoxin [Burkholderia plantarii]